MNKKILLPFLFFLPGIISYAQTYTMPTGSSVTSSITTCSGTFYDNQGAATNYSNNQDASYVFYPATAAQYTRITFTAFDTESGWDFVYVYDGPGGPLLGTYSGTPAVPFSITASSANATHGLCVRFSSDGTTRRPGWTATISCNAASGPIPAFTTNSQDCQQGGGITVCSNSNLTANSGGDGNINDLPSPMGGCLSGENQSSWYYFSPSSSGTIGFTIAPANGTDDYDFAVWGPFTSVTCPINVGLQPIRCSYAGTGGNTGVSSANNAPQTDLSEGAGGNRWVQDLNVTAGQIYVLVIDNYSASSNPFTLTWALTLGASLNCSVLPVEFLTFTGEHIENYHALKWETATENNNHYFSIERATDGTPFIPIGQVEAAGTSTQENAYTFNDTDPLEGWNYYRLRQVDFNGESTVSTLVALEFHSETEQVKNIHPVPANGEVFFEFVSPEAAELRYQLTDCTGRIVSDQKTHLEKGSSTVKINLQENEAGVYFLRVVDSATGFLYTTKIVVE